jgi:hypothetical protein
VDQVSAVIPVLKWLTRSKVLFYCHFPDMLLAQRQSALRRAYRAPLDWVEQATTGRANKVLVNSKFTQGAPGAWLAIAAALLGIFCWRVAAGLANQGA